MEQVIITGLTIQQLKQILADTIRETNEQKAETNPPKEGKFISRKETATLLHISLPTLNDWTKEGILKSYLIGTRVLYKPDEVLETVRQRNYTSVRKDK